jgi:hypothetical protein
MSVFSVNNISRFKGLESIGCGMGSAMILKY